MYQGQHYLTHPYQQLQTIPLLSRLSAEIEGMGIVGTLVIPLHQPVDLAERVATIDVLTGGKFHLGCALGYRDQEYDSFGIDPKKRVARFLECLDIAQKLWTQGKVTYDGKFFQLNDVEDSFVKKWFDKNGLLTNFGYHKDKGTIFEIAFRYVLREQTMIFQMIDYLGQKLHYEKL